MDIKEPNPHDPSPNPRLTPIAERWKDPPVFVPIPKDATREQELRLRFPAKAPPEGTPERAEWDRLGMDLGNDNNTEVER